MTNLKTLQAWSAKLVALIRGTVSRGVVRRVQNGPKMRVVQLELLAGELREVEAPEPYGLTSHPYAGSEAVAGFAQANRDHGIAIVVADRRYRLTTLAEGEVALHDDQGQVVHLKRDGILVESAHPDAADQTRENVLLVHLGA